MIWKLLVRHKLVIIYGAAFALLSFFLKWLELRLLVFNHSLEVYIGSIALIFTVLGIWLAIKLIKPQVKTVVVEKAIYVASKNEFTRNEQEINSLGLSKREMEVLQLMAEGFSNQEIASQLYVSLNTIKTHSSRIFEKLDVKRRTQAVEKAKKLSLIP